MVTISNQSLQQNCRLRTLGSSSTMLPSGTKLPQDNTSYSPTFIDSPDYIQLSSCQMGLKDTPISRLARNPPGANQGPANLKSATNTTLERANVPIPSANISTHAKTVEKPVMERKTAWTTPNEMYGLQPKYLRHNLWQADTGLSPTTAEWSETAPPLPRPSPFELANSAARQTVADNPALFRVHTPIHVDVFENLLKRHPNPEFVSSVCTGLREGFWPWADTLSGGFPTTHDESKPMPSDDRKASFMRDQCLKERHKGYFSESFGTDLLPGMYSMPIYAVPKPHSVDLRLVTDHSAGPFSLNNMIDHSCVTGFPLDNMHHLGEMLLDTRRSIGNVPLTLWRSEERRVGKEC